jgi:hypothetical protein
VLFDLYLSLRAIRFGNDDVGQPNYSQEDKLRGPKITQTVSREPSLNLVQVNYF